MEERRDEYTFMDFLSVIKRRIVWILIVTVIAAAVCGLVTKFVINPAGECYELSFMIKYTNQNHASENGTVSETITYPDGTSFYYERIVAGDRLEAAKQSDESFKSIDTEKMASSDDITVSCTPRDNNSSLTYYTISVPSRYFSDEEQAKKFLKAVCDETRQRIVENAEQLTYTAILDTYDTVISFEKQIEVLENQHLSVLERYEEYLDFYRNFSYENKTLETYYAEASALFNGSAANLEVLKTDLKLNGYLHKETDSDILVRINALVREKKLNESAVDELRNMANKFPAGSSADTGASDGLSAYHTKISEYIDRNVQIDAELAQLCLAGGYTETAAGSGVYEKTGERLDATAFSARLQEVFSLIEAEAQTCGDVIAALYDNCTVFENTQNGVTVTGSASTLKYTLIAAVVAFVAACVVFFVIDYFRNKKTSAPSASAAESEQSAERTEEQNGDKSETK